MYQGPGDKHSPMMYGLMVGLGLIILIVFTQRCGQPPSTTLQETFKPGPTQPGGSSGITLPEPVRDAAATAQAKFFGGEDTPPITPESTSGALAVAVESITKIPSGVRVVGSISNVGRQQLRVPLTAFTFRDQSGQTYGVQGDAQALLAPRQSEIFELEIPTLNPTELVLVIELPDQGVSVEMVLLAGGATPTP